MPIRIVCLLAGLLATAAAHAAGTESLDHFFGDVRTYSARFEQTVLDDALNPLQETSGRLWIDRPGKFRWEYDPPYRQLIIGDGEQVWVYDEDLAQVTVRPMKGALGRTPAILLAGTGQLNQNFTVTPMGTQGNLEWVRMKPKRADGGFEDIRLGFEKGELRALEMVDGIGQTTRVRLNDGRENKPIKPGIFHFEPPAGVDVLREDG